MFENKRPHERKAYVNKQGKICVDKVKTKGNCNNRGSQSRFEVTAIKIVKNVEKCICFCDFYNFYCSNLKS